MDKFVTRAPTWKTLNYASAISASRSRASLSKQADNKKDQHAKKVNSNPLGFEALKEKTAEYECRRLPMDAVVSDSGLSSSTESSQDSFARLTINGDENTPPATKPTRSNQNYLSNLSDYVSAADKEANKTLTISQASHTSPLLPYHIKQTLYDKANMKEGPQHQAKTKQQPMTPKKGPLLGTERVQDGNKNSSNMLRLHTLKALKIPPFDNTEKHVVSEMLEEFDEMSNTPKLNPVMERIQRDLNSPSATARMRALKAMKSPTKSAYQHFDVPYDEQSIITEEERRTPPRPPTIQELMQDIIVYVEVRSGEDNRSAGVKKVISALGARVNDKLLRDTTHVVFKDGLLSTYKKAKNWHIPIVSILWIEACKNSRKICKPDDYPISNVDRYENPELYDKMKRHKSMQPDSECNKRVRAKHGTPKESTPKTATGTHKKTSTLIDGTPTSSASNKKTDISQFFKQLGSQREKGAVETPVAVESPATRLVNRMNSNQYTPVVSVSIKKKPLDKTSAEENNDGNGASGTTPQPQNAKKVIHFPVEKESETETSSPAQRVRQRRRSCAVQSTTQSIREMSLSQTPTIGRSTRRRSSIHVTTNMSMSSNNVDTPRPKVLSNDFMTIAEEENFAVAKKRVSPEKSKRANPRRRTTYSSKPLDITVFDTAEKVVQPKQPVVVNRRRTLFTPQKMEQSLVNLSTVVVQSTSSSTLVGTQNTSQTLIEENQPIPVTFSSSRQPGRRRTLFDVSMDIITQRLQNINQSARRSIAPTGSDNSQELRRTSQDLDSSPMVHKSQTTSNLPSQTEHTNNDATSQTKSNENLSEAVVVDCTPPPKKRKLFMPNIDSPLLTSTLLGTLSTSITSATAAAKTKRRKTLMPVTTQPQSETKLAVNSTIAKLKRAPRRSTLDFEQVQKVKSTMAKKNSTNTLTQSAITSVGGEVTAIEDSLSQPNTKPLPFLVYTNMHSEQIEVIREVLKKLGGFQLGKTVSDNTTHVVSLEPRRTLNMLRGLVRGLWILDYKWITDSLGAGKWLSEEQYELREFSRAVQICRAERQAFGSVYKCELLSDVGAFYISSNCVPMPRYNMKELIELCCGKVVDQREHAKYILGDATKTLDKIYASPFWILDSITQMQMLKRSKYESLDEVSPTELQAQSQ